MSRKQVLLLLGWPVCAFLTLILAISWTYQISVKQVIESVPNNVKLVYHETVRFASVPKIMGLSTVKIKKANAIPELVRQYLAKYNSPMTPYSDQLVAAAREYNVDPILLVAIAQCESNLGKRMPSDDCYNPFGYGIHSRGTKCFDSWEQGFVTEAKFIKEKYLDKGVFKTEDIMVTYTPPALEKGGSWAKCVNQFLEEIKHLE